MNFPFQPQKAVQCAALFIQKEGGGTTVLKLIKLLYLAERKSYESRGVPIFGGDYYSLPHGPITSECLDLMNQRGCNREQCEWDRVVHPRNQNHVELINTPKFEDLSPAEIRIINETYNEHGNKTASQIRNWCHKHLPEYEELDTGRKPITLKKIADAVGVDPNLIKEEAQAASFLANAFA